MNLQVQKAIIVFGLAGVMFWLFRPGTTRKPKDTKEKDKAQQKKDAIVVANGYGRALKAGEKPEALEDLNKATEEKYGLRVYKKHSDDKYYVLDTTGNEILKIT